MGFPHVCDSACEEDHNYDINHPECEEDCDCEDCHKDWHNPLVDFAICDRCYEIKMEVES